ncbi:MAG TPA: tetratricopeptide repeat protein [Galbitalea sp.]
MSNVPISPGSLRGAVDLSSLVNPRPARAAAGAGAGAAVQGESATDATFTQVLDLSNTVPVVVEFYGQGIEPILGSLIASYGGRLAYSVVDAAANPQLAQAFQVQQVPTVAAVIGGRPVQLYVGDYPEAEVRQIFDQLLQLAAEQGVTGTVPASGDVPAEPVEEPLPPHHQEAFDAISTGDYATAIAEYKTAIAQNPRDALAVAGLAQVSLLQRLDGVSPEDIRSAAVSGDLDAQLALADLQLSEGDPGAAFDLLLTLFPTLDAAGKNSVRTRMLDYFEILGSDAPEVPAARRRLTALLY